MDLLTRTGFLIMVRLTKRLPVILIPEQFLITPVRNDMIDYCCRSKFVFPETFHTQRVQTEEQFSGLAPSGIITSGSSTAPERVM